MLDGLPESIVIGISLTSGDGISLPLVVAVFLSNVPESLSVADGMRKFGYSSWRIVGVSAAAAVASGIAAALGYHFLHAAAGSYGATIEAFAAGAILTMLADTLMPEAFEHGGKFTGLVTVLGFAGSFLLSVL